jgi:hypothetical protein
MLNPEWLPLADAMRALAETYGKTPGYNAVWRAAIAQRFPTSRLGRSYFVDRADLPKMAAHFNLRRSTPSAA